MSIQSIFRIHLITDNIAQYLSWKNLQILRQVSTCCAFAEHYIPAKISHDIDIVSYIVENDHWKLIEDFAWNHCRNTFLFLELRYHKGIDYKFSPFPFPLNRGTTFIWNVEHVAKDVLQNLSHTPQWLIVLLESTLETKGVLLSKSQWEYYMWLLKTGVLCEYEKWSQLPATFTKYYFIDKTCTLVYKR